MKLDSHWSEWHGEDVFLGGAGSQRETVVACVVSNIAGLKKPLYTIIPRALCVSGSWEFFVGASNRTLYLKTVRNEYFERLYDESRGDKIYYCRPSLPNDEPIDFCSFIRLCRCGYAPLAND